MTENTKVVIYSGNTFSVPAASTNDEIRATLAAMFPDISTATAVDTTYTLDGVTYEAVEFIKQAGRKGADILDLLLRVPYAAPDHLAGGMRHVHLEALSMSG